MILISICIANTHSRHFEARHAFEQALIDAAGGFTRHDTAGGWRDDDGYEMIEPGHQYDVLLPTPLPPTALPTIQQAAIDFGRALGERSILVTTREVNAQFLNCT